MNDDTDFQRQMLMKMASMIEGTKALTDRVGVMTDKIGRYDAEFEKLSRQNHTLRQDILTVRSEALQQRSDITTRLDAQGGRFDALGSRLEEIENTVDGNSRALRELIIEGVSQYNSILTALQDGIKSQISIRELLEKVNELERRIGI